jgi:hypothetical protein
VDHPNLADRDILASRVLGLLAIYQYGVSGPGQKTHWSKIVLVENRRPVWEDIPDVFR